MCGEKAVFDMCSCHSLGSPPHVRGKGSSAAWRARRRGITPACAGKSGLQGSSRLLRGDHPRMCGEKGLSTFWSRNHSGSPPRMRGKVRAQCVQRDCVGITPAYAGKRDLFPAGKTAPRDHPRMCGEKRPLARWAILPPGSPPHVRGKV